MFVEDYGNDWTARAGNPHCLPKPPQWWLRELKLFDDRLVIFPSQKRATFILARTALRSHGEPLTPESMTLGGQRFVVPQNPDTVFMHLHRLVRVCEIMPGVKWDMRVFHKLAAHDIQRLGGANVVADRLDAADDTRREQIERDQIAEIEARSRDAYKGFKYAIGERLSLAPNRHGRGSVTRNPVSVRVPTPSHPSGPLIRLTDLPPVPATSPDPVKG